MLTFNAYVFVNRVGTAREVREMIPIEPGRVTAEQRDDYSIIYKVRGKNGAEQVFGQDAIWHLRGPSWNTWTGMDATALAANALGLSISLEQGQSDAQKNGVQTTGVFSVKEKLSAEKFAQLAAWMDKHMPGGDRAGKPMILDMEADFKRILMSAVDQQQRCLAERRQREEPVRLVGQVDAQLGALELNRRAAGHLGHQDPHIVADPGRVDVVVQIVIHPQRRSVQPRLVGERTCAHIGLMRIRRQVGDLGQLMRD